MILCHAPTMIPLPGRTPADDQHPTSGGMPRRAEIEWDKNEAGPAFGRPRWRSSQERRAQVKISSIFLLSFLSVLIEPVPMFSKVMVSVPPPVVSKFTNTLPPG